MNTDRRIRSQTEFAARARIYLEEHGVAGLVTELARRGLVATLSFFPWALLLPISIPLHVLGFRRVTVIVGRIGHLVTEVDCLLKEEALGILRRRKWLLLAPPSQVANPHLLGYWKQKVRVIENPWFCTVLKAMSRWILMTHDVSHYVLRLNDTQDIYRINSRWDGRAPILRLRDEDRSPETSGLRELGIPKDGWFVCAHVREPGFSPGDDTAHAHRNGRPEAVIPAMQEIVRRGGFCVRMGDPSVSRLPPMPGVIDYAHHPLRSARMDIVLCASTRFFLGNSSGLALVSSVFGVPCALVNMIPSSALSVLPNDLSIPKLLRFDRESRLLRFDEILGSPIADFRYAKLYSDAGITPVENSPEEILALVREMLDRLEGKHEESEEDQDLQRRFMGLLRPGHYSYGAASRVGAAFLRKYQHLLPA